MNRTKLFFLFIFLLIGGLGYWFFLVDSKRAEKIDLPPGTTMEESLPGVHKKIPTH